MNQTRRLAAILAADVAGYSRLIGADEGGTLEGLRALRRGLLDPKIAEHRGRLVKTTGDGLLVEFGSVVDALRCAVEVQREMVGRNTDVPSDNRIELRIGINVGDIVVEDGDIFGDGVNVAARLEGMAEPGGICVSARVQEDAAGKLDLVFEDMGDQQLKNIARSVRAYRVVTEARPAMPQITAGPPLPDKPSIAVLPFTNMSADPEQEFLADGIAEDVITALSRYPSLFVIARNSSFTYKGRAVDVTQIGRELGVRYVLEGSLRKSGNRIRVTAQCVEAETGKHVWAQRYDRELADIFAVQDEITEAATIAIAPAIADAERQRAMRRPPANLDAWAAYQRGLWHLGQANKDDNVLSQQFFRQAIDLDPNFAGGYSGLSTAYILAVTQFQTRPIAELQELAAPLARRAVALDNTDADARACLAVVLLTRGDFGAVQIEADRALAASPNLAHAHGVRGVGLMLAGEREEGIRSLLNCTRLDPLDPLVSLRLSQIALGHYFSRDYEAAVEVAKRIIQSYPDFPTSYRTLAAALAQVGRLDEAKDTLAKALALAPLSFDMYVRGRPPWIRGEDHAHMLEGLRKAGWKE